MKALQKTAKDFIRRNAGLACIYLLGSIIVVLQLRSLL